MERGKRLLIVGGVAGGASAAARARRLSEDAEIVLFERGPNISFANCGLPYHIGGDIPDRKQLLVQTPAAMAQRFRIDVRTNTEVIHIDRTRRELTVRDVSDGAEHAEPYDALVLSPGAEPLLPPIPGIDSPGVFTLRNLGDMDAIKKVVDERAPARAMVVGAGYIGLEMVEALRHRGLNVTLVELADQVMATLDPEMAAPLHQQLALQGVDLRLGVSLTGIRTEGDALTADLSDGQAAACGLVVVAVGVRPEVDLAEQAGLEIGPTGGIAVDEHMRTSDPDIYAVGDAVEVTHLVDGQQTLIPLAGPANRQGRIAADNVFGRDSAYRGSQGTAICKVFDLTAAVTGLNEKALRKSGTIPHEKVYVHPASHAGYYPGAMPISLKLLFGRDDGKLLGAQAVGAAGVDKRIDVLAVAIRAGMTVYDLQDLELSYAPPYGSAKDPVNYAGFVASNVLKGDAALCHVEDVCSPTGGQALLDVRTVEEVRGGTIPGTMNIPLDELRDRLDEVPRDKELLVVCQVGLRGYLACRLLTQKGFRCRNLTGGYKTYQAATGTGPNVAAQEELQDDTGAAPPAPTATAPAPGEPIKHIDACGLQCPGPIMKLKTELEPLRPGESVTITATDSGFAADVGAWCNSTGNTLRGVEPKAGGIQATIVKGGAAESAAAPATASGKRKTIVVFSNDLDRVMAAFIIANGAAAMGSDVTLFFTFWGLNVLRRNERIAVRKNAVERIFGWMMPRGAKKLKLSKMNMAGMGTEMMKGIMRDKNVQSLPKLINSAQHAGVRLVACAMTMDLMGIKREELIDGIEEGGVAMYLNEAEGGNVNLFI
jgi:NADPH-dependent 2,4-dienoyl-CoA reductase/sulfur reductase-like enzyme/peroxiredoxin family protein/rhodanese-related sulfurtransferase/TusA-related sulfurtransferase